MVSKSSSEAQPDARNHDSAPKDSFQSKNLLSKDDSKFFDDGEGIARLDRIITAIKAVQDLRFG